MDIWMRLAAACEAFREREGSSAPGVLSNNISMNEKLATRSFATNHWLLSGLCPDHGPSGSYQITSGLPTIRELSRLAFEARRQMRSVLRLARGRTFLENCTSNGRALWVRRPNFPVGGTVSPGGWRGW